MKLTFQEATSWLYNQLPMFQRDGAVAYKPNLDNTIALLNLLDNPHVGIKTIHIAGTNGKGSVSHSIAAMFQAKGFVTGLYTSPHLKNFTERIKINGIEIEEDFVATFVNKMMDCAIKASFFEMTVAMAFDYFKYKNTDYAIIETGMGGRLDSTNVILPILSIITNIGLDHQQFLGNTLPLIAAEKAGIIKKDTPVIIGEMQDEIADIFKAKSKELDAPLYFADKIIPNTFDTSKGELKGSYQIKNRKTVYAAYKILNEQLGFNFEKIHLEAAYFDVVKLTGLRGRFETLQNNPKIIIDTGHNEQAMDYIIPQLTRMKHKKLIMVIGFVNDKDIDKILVKFPKDAYYIFCKPSIPRGLDANITKLSAEKYGLKGEICSTVELAIKTAKLMAGKDDLIFIGGSTFVVAEAI